ncbi:MAG: divalent metal cation transporter, partial [Limosilactobacillus sp.]|nr:divalent metal cation transporter [Limosilactobacillus sp.]
MNNSQTKHRSSKLISHANGKSLEEINGTVEVLRGKGFFRTLLAYSGPGALVAVGYMDP